jgi:hypothetical protein
MNREESLISIAASYFERAGWRFTLGEYINLETPMLRFAGYLLFDCISLPKGHSNKLHK